MASIVNYVAKTNWTTNETVKPTDYNKVEQGIKDNNDGLKALNTEVGGLPTLVASKVDKVDIVDDLTTSDASKVLSAKQGKLLNDNKVNISSIVNNLTSTATNVPLSANQGRLLNNNKVNISDIVDNLNSTVVTVPLSANQGRVLNENKVDKISGKGLSTNDFTDTLLTKLDGIKENANYVLVRDSLTSTSISDALSAYQGKMLNDNKVNTSNIVDNLNSTVTTVPLSANQGRLLNNNKVNISDIVDSLNSTATNKPLSANQGRVLSRNTLSLSKYTDNASTFLVQIGDYNNRALQILTMKTTVTASISSAYGNLFTGTATINFPSGSSFYSAPVVTLGKCKMGAGANWATVADTTDKSVTIRFIDAVSRSSASIDVELIAIGSWY